MTTESTDNDKTNRHTTITISRTERQLLDAAKQDLYQTTEVTHGAALQRLVDEATDVDVDGFE